MRIRKAIAIMAAATVMSGLHGSASWPDKGGTEGDAASLLAEEPHPRRYYIIWRKLLQGDNETYDLGVYDPMRKTPQYDPRIPY